MEGRRETCHRETKTSETCSCFLRAGAGQRETTVRAESAVQQDAIRGKPAFLPQGTKWSQDRGGGLGGMTMQLPAPEGMQGDGTALPFTLSFGHSRFWVTNTNPQWLVWSSHKMQTLLLQVCGLGVVDPTGRTEAGSLTCPGSWCSSPGSAVPLLV